MGERGVFEIGEGLFGLGVVAVYGSGLGQGNGLSVKMTWWRQTPNSLAHPLEVQALHAAHDQPGGGVELLLAGERCERGPR
ncbi:hypothetical protein OG985_45575 [Streptomyces sp. NBC_00289]|uniref:hypothetical protein n=1 Tax=Streptomyces sp. NBC_00289 TaxID=2975703 RepID=UPI00324CA729